MTPTLQKQFSDLLRHPLFGKWLTIQAQLGKTSATLEVYARNLRDYQAFCQTRGIDYLTARHEHVAAYIHNMASRDVGRNGTQHGYANATMRQHLVAVRLFYDFLMEEQLREDNPFTRGAYTASRGFGGSRRGLLPHYQRLPWIPSEEQWHAILMAAQSEPIRNRLMLALAYDGALRREELCLLSTGDIDPAYRLITLRAETTKTRKGRVVHYSEATDQLYALYLRQRFTVSRQRGVLFLSESRRNRAQPLTKWTWSKVIKALAERAGVPQFTTHTLRHLRLTDLARSGWEMHEIATYAGHKSINTTLAYIHLSGRELAVKLSKGMDSIHAWRTKTISTLLP